MRLGGLQPCSLQDFPGKVAAVVFARGCNLRCPYCHNPQLSDLSRAGQNLSEDEFFAFLTDRKGKLSGVVVSGGEPTLQADLPRFLEKIRDMGFAVKLDTNGTRPDMLAELLTRRLVDYVAMDLKDLPEGYSEWLGPTDPEAIRTSLVLLRASRISHELRTTVTLPRFDLARLLAMSSIVNSSRWWLQRALPGPCLEPDVWDPLSESGLDSLGAQLCDMGIAAQLRRQMVT